MFHSPVHALDGTRRDDRPERRGQMVPAVERRPDCDEERTLVCVDCGHAITTDAARTERLGAHAHTFPNPDGLRFCIGCFTEAPGVRVVGEESGYFTWFPGFAWTVAVCAG